MVASGRCHSDEHLVTGDRPFELPIIGGHVTLMEKQVVGSLFGSANPRADIPKLLELYHDGQLDLDGLVTATYTLDEVSDGYDDMCAGKNIRGVLYLSRR